jgi:Glyoxalase/Bleomycin resistance protein/Dioxygenase superfamily
MTTPPTLDHMALSVPNLDEHVARLTTTFGMVAELHFEGAMAVITDPASGLKLELSASADSEVHFRHFGFRADDVDRAHASLVEAGMESNEEPQRQDFAHMYQSRLHQPGGLEVQLVKYD